MSTIQAKVVLTLTIGIDKEDYRDAYDEDCEENGDEPEGEVPDDYVLDALKQEIKDGDFSLDDELTDDAIIVVIRD